MVPAHPMSSNAAQSGVPADPSAATTLPDLSRFGVEFRELARQRRFVREAEQAVGTITRHAAAPGGAPRPSARQHATPPPIANPTAGRPASATSVDQRISADAAAMLAEMSRLADRVIESREELGSMRTRAERAERELAAVNDRMLAARALVHEAQRSAHDAGERCAWFEGRVDALEEALELAVNASFLQRWRWRRRIAASLHAHGDK